jgi:hypothetical protein
MALVRRQWPEAAAVEASSLQAWADRLLAAVDAGRVQLPVVEGEIGDTWVSAADAWMDGHCLKMQSGQFKMDVTVLLQLSLQSQ